MEYSILILITPLFLFLFLGLVGGKLRPNIAGIIGTLGMGFCAVLAYSVAYQYFFVIGKTADSWQSIMPINFEWLRFTELLHIDLGILLDPISVMMLVVITTVSFMVHIYSLGYMHGEVGFQRYYALLSLFSFSMLGLVVATNIFQMYIFWELVGVSSYSLIGFYYQKPSAVLASKKAFIVTRFADLGFLIGILILSYYTKTFDFATLTANNAELVISSFAGGTFMGMSLVSVALALIFMGGAGKSAMFPLHIWLPDAMEGPTPVSALIHAATMVVAGVFLVARLFPVYFFAAPDVLTMIAYIGAFTALFAAVIAITQTDIKRVLAFSTISQIAYMMAALGVSKYGDHDGLGYMASMFHLFTHAFFKALLFLGAGSVIHAVHSNEMKDMGNLHKYMKITSITFLIACFLSKDEILAATFHNQPIVFWTLWIVAGLTAFYMFRLYFGIFFNGKRDYEHKPHESGLPMAIPLMILAVFSVFTGLIPFSEFISSDNKPFEMHIDMVVASLSVVAAIVGIVVAYTMYFKDSDKPAAVAARLKGLYTASLNKFYLDEVWMFITKKVIFNCVSRPIAWFDRHVIDGTMDNIANVTQKASHRVRGLQSGQMQRYVAFLVAGTILIAILVLIFV